MTGSEEYEMFTFRMVWGEVIQHMVQEEFLVQLGPVS
jgi:hypothetical protein